MDNMEFTFKYEVKRVYGEDIIFVELFLNGEKIAQASGYSTANAVSDKRWARAKAKYLRDKFLLDRKKAPRFKLNYGNM